MLKRQLVLCALALALTGCSSLTETVETLPYTSVSPTSSIEDIQIPETSSVNASTEAQTDTTVASTEVETAENTSDTSDETTEDNTEATTESSTEEPTEPVAETDNTTEAPAPVVMYTTRSVNVRKAPSTDAEKVDLYQENTEVTVYSISDGWAAIKAGDATYYIFAEYLSEAKPETQPATEPVTEPATVPATEPVSSEAQETNPQPTQSGNITVTAVSYCGVLYTQGNGPTVCIDPGHMAHGDSRQEPSAPGATTTKARATTGTEGCVTHIHESIINLQASLQLRDELLARGYNVMMTRESEDVNISNMERALMASNDGADIFVRIHCNSVDNSEVTGIVIMAPTAANPYVGHMYNQCYSLSENLMNSMLAATGAGNKGIQLTDSMSGINWSSIPVAIVEMGFMSNPTEDQLLCDASYQAKLVQGMANGIDAYFGR